MIIRETAIKDLLIIEPKVHADKRGYFVETYLDKSLKEAGYDYDFVQDNEAFSVDVGVVRGLHYQMPAHAQAKLVRVIKGAVYDVAVDLRPGSETFGHHVGAVLSETNKWQMLVPRGFAHGYMTMEPNTIFVYKCDNYYNRASERGVKWDDPALGIDWPNVGMNYVLSDKDLALPSWTDHERFM